MKSRTRSCACSSVGTVAAKRKRGRRSRNKETGSGVSRGQLHPWEVQKLRNKHVNAVSRSTGNKRLETAQRKGQAYNKQENPQVTPFCPLSTPLSHPISL